MGKSALAYCLIALALLAGCKSNRKKNMVITQRPAPATEVDSTVYGKCGMGTAMNTLELITDGGDTVSYQLSQANSDNQVIGGLAVGDRMAIVGTKDNDGEYVAQKVINLTSLLGRWSNISESFEICEGGLVKSNMKEPTPRTEWKICNGKLLLSADTFNVTFIGPDSLYLNRAGVMYGYRRMPSAVRHNRK